MTIRFQVRDKIIHDGYLGNVPCSNCGHMEQNYVIVWVKTFFISYIPIFSWQKNVNVTCNNCQKSLDITETAGDMRQQLEKTSASHPVWPRNIIASFFGLLFAGSLLNLAFVGFKDLVTSDKSKLTGHWELRNVSTLTTEILSCDEGQKDMSFLNLYDNGDFSLVYFDTVYIDGKWDYADHTLSLDNNDQSSKLHLTKLDDEHMEMTVQEDSTDKQSAMKHKIFSFREYAVSAFQKNASDQTNFDPFRAEFNQWRKKPDHPESDKEIKKRVYDFVSFLTLTFNTAIENDVSSFDREIVSPFQIATNGIVVLEEYPQWAKVFYSAQNAQKGHEFLKSSFPKEMNFKEENVFIRTRDFFEVYKKNLLKL